MESWQKASSIRCVGYNFSRSFKLSFFGCLGIILKRKEKFSTSVNHLLRVKTTNGNQIILAVNQMILLTVITLGLVPWLLQASWNWSFCMTDTWAPFQMTCLGKPSQGKPRWNLTQNLDRILLQDFLWQIWHEHSSNCQMCMLYTSCPGHLL